MFTGLTIYGRPISSRAMEIFQPFGVGQYQSSMGWVIAVAFTRVGSSRDGAVMMKRQG
ncbi:hypothetical protein D3C72_1574050 [compost metagenome]